MVSKQPVWDEQQWSEPPTLEGDVTTDVCVIGLGGSGISCIHELLRLGKRVIGIERGSIAGGAAGRNGGFLLAGTARFYHDSVTTLGRERARMVYHRTLAEVERIAKETPTAVRQVGSLRVAASDEERHDCDTQYTAMAADGLPVERYSGPEGEGLRFPHDAAMQPLLRCRLLAEQVQQAGTPLYSMTSAVAIKPGQVVTPRGTISCQQIIVAVDGGLDRIFPALRPDVWTVRLQMLATAPTSEVSLPCPVYRRWGYDYWQQLPNGRIALGGFRDRDFGSADPDVQPNPTDEVQAALERLLRTEIGVQAHITHRWAALVGYTATHLPLAREIAAGIWALGGYSGTGNVIGALCGRGVAQLVARGTTSLLDGII